MMEPKAMLQTIYLGDRYCKKFIIDHSASRVLIQMDSISRIRSASGNWDYYSDEDIKDGYIVFTKVVSIKLNPPNLTPNDYIELTSVEQLSPKNSAEHPSKHYLFKITAGVVDELAESREVHIEIVAEGVHLEDPTRSRVIII